MDLTNANSYIFDAKQGEFTDRFVLYLNKTLLGDEEIADVKSSDIYAAGKSVFVEIPQTEKGAVMSVYDINGQILRIENLNSVSNEFMIQKSGVYIIKLQTKTQVKKQKIIIL
ncbi:MAG: T9SS type A sorting domain-containing protein [Bacteroidales bacterium]|nr:T9SS type A sorting domain-containing protein [Bacteroidales bacterium]